MTHALCDALRRCAGCLPVLLLGAALGLGGLAPCAAAEPMLQRAADPADWLARGQEGELLPELEVPNPFQGELPEQKFPSDDAPPAELPGGTWTLLDPQFIGPDGTPGIGPWLLTFFTARSLPTFEPDIKEPGPDSANFPNSAFTLPPGEIYIETSPFTYQEVPFFTRRNRERQSQQISLPTLIRIGMLRNFELRLFSQTFTSEAFLDRRVIGFGPLTFDSKFHFWDQDKQRRIPAFGVQLMTSTNIGSPDLTIDQWEPQFSLNFDYEFENGFQLEWNIGGAWTINEREDRIYQANFQGALQRELIKDVDWFIQGYLNVPQSTRFKEGAAIGAGVIWFVSKQMALDTSYSFSVKAGTPDPIYRLGLSLAL